MHHWTKREAISAVFQEERLCEYLTAIENIRLVTPCLAVDTIRQEMDKLGLSDCFGQPVSELSGGMRRRVSILKGAVVGNMIFSVLMSLFRGWIMHAGNRL